MKLKKVSAVLLCLILFGLGFMDIERAGAQRSASLYLGPAVGTFTVGSTFTVSLYLNTGGETVNAVEAFLHFPADKLQVVSPTTGKSFVSVWISQPSYSNTEGTLHFQGTIPSPGIATDAGLVSTVTFRVKDIGRATIHIRDESRVLLNDGRGTDILAQKTDAVYELVLPPPAGPVVTSRTHTDQEEWSKESTAVLEWASPSDTEGYSYVLSESISDEPDNISEGSKTRVVYDNLSDGIYYFHIKRLRQGAWGGVTTYPVRVDKLPPARFDILISPNDHSSNRRPIIDFRTTDSASGVDYYELKIIPLDQDAIEGSGALNTAAPFFIEANSPYSRELSIGRYDVVVRAYDEAGNYYQATKRFSITKPLFAFLSNDGLRLGSYNLPWGYAWLVILLTLGFLAYIARLVWHWHRLAELYSKVSVEVHPVVSKKLGDLRTKQREYGKIPHAILTIGFLFYYLIGGASFVEAQTGAIGLPIEPPVVSVFPSSISNDEILYVGGRAGAPGARVLIYLQHIDSGSTLSKEIVTDGDGAWFYTFPQFLTSGEYAMWTQLKVGENMSPPSARISLAVEPTAIQIGNKRLSYQNVYFVLLLCSLLALIVLLVFILRYGNRLRVRRGELGFRIKEAEESIRRGFALLRRDIEEELAVIRKAKLSHELREEEREREAKLLRDLELVSGYVGKEVLAIEEAERNL